MWDLDTGAASQQEDIRNGKLTEGEKLYQVENVGIYEVNWVILNYHVVKAVI